MDSPQASTSDSDKKIHQSWGGDEGQTELAAETAAANDVAAEQAAPAENWGASGGGDDWGTGGGNTEWGATAGGGDTEPTATAEGGNTEWGAEGGTTDWGGGGGDNADWAAPAPASTTNVEEPSERSDRRRRDRQEEEPDNTLTVEQYLAQQKEKSSIIPRPDVRKIEQDESLWEGAKELVKGGEGDDYFVGKVGITCALAFAHILTMA